MEKNRVFSNLIWKFAERVSAQCVTLVVSIILARLLAPSDYGTVTLVTIFITFANVFVSDGLGSALIRKKDADALDFSSVLYLNVSLSVLLYMALFFTAPLITKFFGDGYTDLTPAIRVLGIRLIFSAVNSVQQAYISKKMIFRKFFAATLTGTIVSAFVGIWMAYAGFGVWALIAQYLTNTFVDTVFLMFSIRKVPLFKFSVRRLKGIIGFGMGVLGTNILITTYQEFRAILIGKYYTTNDLAYYKKGAQFPDLLTTNINASVSAVLFPRFAELGDDVIKAKQTAKNAVRMSFFIVAPLLVGLGAVADNFVSVVLTDKWAGCVVFIRLFCLNSLFYTIHSTNMQLLKVFGKARTYVIMEFVKKMIEMTFLLLVFRIGVVWIAAAMATTSTLFTYLNCIPTKRNLGYSFSEQFKDIVRPLCMCVVMLVVVLLVGMLPLNKVLLLVIQVCAGVLVYVGLSVVTKNKEFRQVLGLIKNYLRTK